jgi:hypothetical protein
MKAGRPAHFSTRARRCRGEVGNIQPETSDVADSGEDDGQQSGDMPDDVDGIHRDAIAYGQPGTGVAEHDLIFGNKFFAGANTEEVGQPPGLDGPGKKEQVKDKGEEQDAA